MFKSSGFTGERFSYGNEHVMRQPVNVAIPEIEGKTRIPHDIQKYIRVWKVTIETSAATQLQLYPHITTRHELTDWDKEDIGLAALQCFCGNDVK